MKSYPRFVAALAAIAIAIPVAHADPVVPVGYYVENYASGIGAANGLAIGPDGLLYVADYAAGQLLRRTASGTLEVVASGMPYASGVVFSPTGRIFVVGGNTNVYEIIGGTATIFATGFSYVSSLAIKGNDLFVSSESGIQQISTLTGQVSTAVANTISGNPYGLSFDAVGNLYFLDHAAGQVWTYDFINAPRIIASIPSYSGTYTGFGFGGQFFWGDYHAASLMRLPSTGTPEVFATGFAGGAAPPAIGPNQTIADGANAILVADGHNVWRIAQLPVGDGVVHERSLRLRQTKGGWALSCTVRYAAVNGSHDHHVVFTSAGPGITAAPIDVTVGPRRRSFTTRVPGVRESAVLLTQKMLLIEDTVFLAALPVRGAVNSCRGSVQDATSGGYLRGTFLQDVT
ncbi:MAG: hypothetical protein U1F11_10590 [Steroidobacteraceae bacterium]